MAADRRGSIVWQRTGEDLLSGSGSRRILPVGKYTRELCRLEMSRRRKAEDVPSPIATATPNRNQASGHDVVSRNQATAPDVMALVQLMDQQRRDDELRRAEESRRSEERMATMQQQFMAMLQAQTAQQTVDAEQRRLAEERRAEDARAAEERRATERRLESAARKEEADRLEVLKRAEQLRRDTPKMARMTPETDVEEFIELFEVYVEELQLDQQRWLSFFRPLLNDECRDAMMGLSQRDRADYVTVRDHIIDQCGVRHTRLGDAFWCFQRAKGQTFAQSKRKLLRLLNRFVQDKQTRAEALDAILSEKLVQMLPSAAATHVRDKNPGSSNETARMADLFFQDRHSSPDNPRWLRKPAQQRQERGDSPRQHTPQNDYSSQESTQATNSPGEKSVTLLTQNRRGPKCFHCKDWGHIAVNCPKKVMVLLCPRKEANSFVVSGKIQGVSFTDLLIDSGADMTVVQDRVVPNECYTARSLAARGFGRDATYCKTAMVELEVQGRRLEMEVLVAPPNFLDNTALLGRDVPFLRDLLKDDPQMIHAVHTRAQKKEAELQEAADQAVSDLSGAEPVPFEDLPEFDGVGDGEALGDVVAEDMEDGETLGDFPEGDVETAHGDLLVSGDMGDSEIGDVADEDMQIALDDLPRSEDGGEGDVTMDGAETGEEDVCEVLDPVISGLDEDLFITPAPSPLRMSDQSSCPSMDGFDPFVNLDRDQLIQLQHDDCALDALWQEVNTDSSHYLTEDGALLHYSTSRLGETLSQLVIPTPLRGWLFGLAHKSPLMVHLGKKKTVQKLLKHFFWPGLGRDVAAWCKECPECQRGNKSRRVRAPLMPLPVVGEPFRRVAMDLVGPLQRTPRGNKYVLTLMDFATRYPEAVPLKKIDARTVADALCQIFSRMGIPAEVLSDRGANFLSSVMKTLFQMLGVAHIKTSPYHPQTDGMLERFHGTLKAMLRKTCPVAKDWDQWLPYLCFAFRDAPHSATGFSPFELLFGRDVRGPLTLLKEQWEAREKLPQSIVGFVSNIQQKLYEMAELAQESDQAAKEKAKVWYDQKARHRAFEVGDEVLVLLPEDTSKLTAQWHGPYIVVEKVSSISYRIRMPERRKKIRQFHVNMMKKWNSPKNLMTVMVAQEDLQDDKELPVCTLDTGPDGEDEPTMGKNLLLSQKDDLAGLLERNSQIFCNKPGFTTMTEHHIRTGDSAPIHQRPYRVPVAWQEAVRQEILQMLSLGIITPSDSPWASPIVTVRKKDGCVSITEN